MYPNLEEIETTDIHEFVNNKQQAFQRAFELVRHNLNEKQKRRNVIYNKKVHGPTYKEGQEVLQYHPAIVIGTTSKFASPGKGPYVIEKSLKEVTFKIQEENSSKQQIVHYYSIHFSNLHRRPIYLQEINQEVFSQHKTEQTQKHIDGTLNQDDCLSFVPAPSSIFTPISRRTNNRINYNK